MIPLFAPPSLHRFPALLRRPRFGPTVPAALAVSLLLASGCAGDGEGAQGEALTVTRTPLALPAVPGAGMPFVASGPDLALISWIEPSAGGHAVRVASLDGDGWSDPVTVAESDRFFVNWADFPSVHVLPDGSAAAHWLVRSGEGTFDYDIYVAVSPDGGRTWTRPAVIHEDGVHAEHGFLSFFALEGGFGAIWLDGRQVGLHDEAAERGEEGPPREMTLRFGTLDLDGTARDLEVVDPRICECCQTSAAVTDEGPVVVYRDRSPDEIRDIAVVRLVQGRWTEPRPVHHDGWEIHGCPVNGPVVSASGRHAVTAWFTAADDVPRVRVAFSDDAGATWDPPVQVDEGAPVGRVDVELLADGSAFVVWMEGTEDGAELRARRVHPSGEASASTGLATTSRDRAAGFPRMARVGDGVVLAWSEPGEASRVHTVRLELERAP